MNKNLKNLLMALGVAFLCVVFFCVVAVIFSPDDNSTRPSPTPSFADVETSTFTSVPISSPFPTRSLLDRWMEYSTPTGTLTPSLTPTITSTPTKTPLPTKTPDPRTLYLDIPSRELYTYPDNHAGELVRIRGLVFNINGDDELQIFLGGNYDYPAYISFDKSFSDIYEDEYITIYGVVIGETCGTNAFGGEICQPLLVANLYEK